MRSGWACPARQQRFRCRHQRDDHDRFVAFLKECVAPCSIAVEPTADHRTIGLRLVSEGFDLVLVSSVAGARLREAVFNSSRRQPRLSMPEDHSTSWSGDRTGDPRRSRGSAPLVSSSAVLEAALPGGWSPRTERCAMQRLGRTRDIRGWTDSIASRTAEPCCARS
jgi:hypothetical protein